MKIINQYGHLKYNILEYDVVDSTMNVVKDFSEDTVIVAKAQENGRGKGDRIWNSNNCNNLYFSISLKANKKNINYSQLSFVASIAMRQSINCGSNIIVSKWPNDILINEKKVCGILLEFDYSKNTLIIGVGVNIDYFPETIMFKATSLKNEKIIVEKHTLLKEFLSNFNFLVKEWEQNGFSIIRNKWLSSCYKLKETIEINGEKGIFEDLDNDGTLILRLSNNKIKYVKSGDVF